MPKLTQTVLLDAPRGLTEHERAVLDFLLTSPLAHKELHTQAQTTEVVARCDCGCRSVVLKPDPATPTATFSAHEVSIKGSPSEAVVYITAYGESQEGISVQVTLHVIGGRLDELEIWDGWLDLDGKSNGAVPDAATLSWDLPNQ